MRVSFFFPQTLLYSTIFPLAELYHQRQAPQTFYPHPGVIPNSMSHGNIIRSHCSTFVSGSAAAAAAASSAGGLGGSNSEIMALNASMLTSTNGNNGSNNTTTDFGVGVPTLMQQPHASILRSSVDNLLSQQHPMMVISFQIFLDRHPMAVSRFHPRRLVDFREAISLLFVTRLV